MISAAPFRDRVVHHALCNIIEPIFERTFIDDTYANRKGKGTHAGIRRCQVFMRQYAYVLKADIRKYFPSIDHAILKSIIARKVKCPRTLSLIDLIIDNSNPQEPVQDYFPGDDLFSPPSRRKEPVPNLLQEGWGSSKPGTSNFPGRNISLPRRGKREAMINFNLMLLPTSKFTSL